jgi:hypothetical protein
MLVDGMSKCRQVCLPFRYTNAARKRGLQYGSTCWEQGCAQWVGQGKQSGVTYHIFQCNGTAEPSASDEGASAGASGANVGSAVGASASFGLAESQAADLDGASDGGGGGRGGSSDNSNMFAAYFLSADAFSLERVHTALRGPASHGAAPWSSLLLAASIILVVGLAFAVSARRTHAPPLGEAQSGGGSRLGEAEGAGEARRRLSLR